VTALATDIRSSTATARILDAAVVCVGRWGVAKTTLDDVARQAGCSRATVYRTFPGGKDALLAEAGVRELTQAFAELAARVRGSACIEDAVLVVVREASSAIAGHAALQYLLTHEPQAIAPYVSFDGLNPLLAWAGSFGRAHLSPLVADEVAAAELGEWLARIVVSYACDPVEGVDLADEATARRFVRRYVLPGLSAVAIEPGRPAGTASIPTTITEE
jgi:AcrR family transcriptional regulator